MSKAVKYTEEFKQEALSLILDKHYTIVKVSENLGVSKSTLDIWLKKYREKESIQLNESDQARLKRLEKENKELKMERDILKKAAIFFAGESG